MKEFIRKIVVFLLTLEAKAVLKKYKPKIIVVTGSVGKTSTKDATYAALKHHAFVRKSEKSFNSDIGVPLTILGLPNGWGNGVQWVRNLIDGFLLTLVTTPYPQWVVVEVGADRPGDISKSLAWLEPDVVVTTRFPDVPVHVEFYTSPEEVVCEELHPISQLATNGVAVVNTEDEHAMSADVPKGRKRLTYGFSKDADVKASHYRVLTKKNMPNGISFVVSYKTQQIRLSLYGIIGQTHVYAVLGGVAGALAAGASLENMERFAESFNPPPGRMRLIEGAKGSMLIDDSYNASPIATAEALRALHSAPATRRIAVLADMFELGRFSAEEHRRIGDLAKECADVVVAVGVRARSIVERLEELGASKQSIHVFERGSDAADYLFKEIQKGDVILIKGSQGMRMERAVKVLMANPTNAEQLLARQDPEWLGRP